MAKIMDRRIHDILNEEINKFILSENLNSLMAYSNALEKQLNQLSSKTSNGFNNDINKFLERFTYYVLQVIFAVNRCVQANSLNEGLGGYGLNIPPELGGNFINDFKRGYYNTVRTLNGWGR